MSDPPLEVRPVASAHSSRLAAVSAGAVVLVLVTVIIGGRLGQAAGRPPAVASAVPSPAASVLPSTSSSPLVAYLPASAAPRPSRLVPFRISDGAGGLLTYVSPNLGFAVPLLLDLPPSGYWDEGGPPADAGGVLTFDVPAESAAIGNGGIQVAVGSKRDPAPIRVPADSGPVTPIWAATLVDLVQQYGLLLHGQFRTQTRLILDGEGALLFERPGSAAAVVLAVHHGRIYVLASLTASATRGASRRAFSEFLAAFRFVEPTVRP